MGNSIGGGHVLTLAAELKYSGGNGTGTLC